MHIVQHELDMDILFKGCLFIDKQIRHIVDMVKLVTSDISLEGIDLTCASWLDGKGLGPEIIESRVVLVEAEHQKAKKEPLVLEDFSRE